MKRRSEAADGESVYGETSSREQGESVPRRTNPGNARVHHHLLDPSRSDLGLEFVKDDVVDHGAKAIRQFRQDGQVRIGRGRGCFPRSCLRFRNAK
jgi:hypothetical protein